MLPSTWVFLFSLKKARGGGGKGGEGGKKRITQCTRPEYQKLQILAL